MIIKDEQKVVDYFGMRLTVPNEDGFLATDSNGKIYWASGCFLITDEGYWASRWNDAILICTTHLDGMDWKDTLMEV